MRITFTNTDCTRAILRHRAWSRPWVVLEAEVELVVASESNTHLDPVRDVYRCWQFVGLGERVPGDYTYTMTGLIAEWRGLQRRLHRARAAVLEYRADRVRELRDLLRQKRVAGAWRPARALPEARLLEGK